MSEYKSIGQVAFRKPLARCGMEELAARQRTLEPTGGVAFARNADGDQKTAARQLVLDLFAPERWPGRLHMLTTPGVHWRFERKLLATREPGWMRRPAPTQGTYFTACENDRAIFFASVAQMPGLHTPASELKRIKPFPFAETGVKTRYASFFFANVDELMSHDWSDGWNAVWLDYTGPLTVERLALIQRLYQQYVSGVLIVTAMKSRFNKATTKAVERAGGHSPWLRKHLVGEVLHDIEYFDTSSMAQFAVRKGVP